MKGNKEMAVQLSNESVEGKRNLEKNIQPCA